jgi:pimeloyl-ACP methyl ester carboxylesterase
MHKPEKVLLIALGFISFFSFCNSKALAQKNIDTLLLENPEPYHPERKDVGFNYHKMETKDRNCKLYVKETGSKKGSPIIFLHGGWGMEHTPFVPYFAYQLDLASKHRLIFYDQRGSLRSPCKNYDSISVTKHVKDLERIRKQLNIDEFRIIAWSMGSFLAYRYIDKYEKHVDGLLAIGPLPLFHHDSLCKSSGVDVKEKMWGRTAYQKVLKQTGLKGRKKSSYDPIEMA